MSLVPSLLQAIVKADGEAMVMHAGDKPYVVSPTGQVELASRGLTLEAVNGIVGQLLPAEIQKALEEFGAIQYELPALPEFPSEHFTVVAARGGDDVWVEIRRRRIPDEDRVPEEMFPPQPASRPAVAAAVVPPPPPAVAAPPPAVSAPGAAVAAARLPQQEAIAAHAATQTLAVGAERAHEASPPVIATVSAGATMGAEEEGEEIDLDQDLTLPDDAQLFGSPVKPFADSEPAEEDEQEIDLDAAEVEIEIAASIPESEPAPDAEIPSLARVMSSPVTAPATELVTEAVVGGALDAVPDIAPALAMPAVEPVIVAEWTPTPLREEVLDSAPHHELVATSQLDITAPPEAERVAPPQSEAIAEIALPVAPQRELLADEAPIVTPSIERMGSPDLGFLAALESELTPSPLAEPLVEPVAPPELELIAALEDEPSAPPPQISEVALQGPRMIEESTPVVEAVAPPPPERTSAPASEQTAMPEPELVAPMTEADVVPRTFVEERAVAAVDVPPTVAQVETPVAERRVVPRRPAPPPRPVPAAAPPALSHLDEPVSALPEAYAAAPVTESPHAAAPLDDAHEIVVATAPQAAVVLPISRSPIRGEQLAPSLNEAAMPGLEPLLRLAAARGASTLYLSSGSRPSMRVDGELHVIDAEPAHTSRDVESLLLTLMPERNHEALRSGAQTEWICDIDGVGRVRCMSFRDHRGPGGVFRLMPTRSVSVEQLGLPRHVQSLAIEPSGLVLIAGPRSSGKRTLMAAFVDLMNRTRRDHIITIEREINIVQEGGHSFISQREVRGDDDEMVAAARTALREDPDVLVIEDLRTGALVNVALEAAAAGRLVVGGFSAHTAGGAIDRIIDLYAPDDRRHVQMALADSLRGVVVQVLLRKVGGGRMPAREVLLNTPSVSSVIAEGKTSQLPMAIEGGRRYGMVPMNDALVALVQSGAVEAREAYRQSPDRAGFLASLTRNGLDTSFVERLA